MTLTPAMRMLLVHMRETGGWLYEDPVRVQPCTLWAMERRGLINLGKNYYGTPVSAILTDFGYAASASLVKGGQYGE